MLTKAQAGAKRAGQGIFCPAPPISPGQVCLTPTCPYQPQKLVRSPKSPESWGFPSAPPWNHGQNWASIASPGKKILAPHSPNSSSLPALVPIKLSLILRGVCSPSSANYCSNPFEIFSKLS